MEVIKISPRGYCYGVVDAMVIARNAALDKTFTTTNLYSRNDLFIIKCNRSI